MNNAVSRTGKPKIAVVMLSSTGIVQACDKKGKRIPEYSGEYTRELRAKILEAAPEDAIFAGPVNCKEMTKEEFRRKN